MLPKRERIAKGSEIKAILGRKRAYFSSPLLYVVAEENNFQFSRLAVVCPRRLGSAVKRNRIRRVIVAAFSKIRHNIAKNIDVVVVPRRNEMTIKDCGKELEPFLRGAGE